MEALFNINVNESYLLIVFSFVFFQAEGFHGELEEFLLWLRRTESQLSAAKPTGGLPETAREQLQQHMVIVLPTDLDKVLNACVCMLYVLSHMDNKK